MKIKILCGVVGILIFIWAGSVLAQSESQASNLAKEAKTIFDSAKSKDDYREFSMNRDESQPSASGARETGSYRCFTLYNDGTVLDTRTNLMWAAKDNSSNINWANAESYCDNYRGGRYTDWRMPTQDELEGLYDAGKPRPVACYAYQIHVATELIDITCFAPWASETRSSEAAVFGFSNGTRLWYRQANVDYGRALPVRSGK